jgi:hypothetical protein
MRQHALPHATHIEAQVKTMRQVQISARSTANNYAFVRTLGSAQLRHPVAPRLCRKKPKRAKTFQPEGAIKAESPSL